MAVAASRSGPATSPNPAWHTCRIPIHNLSGCDSEVDAESCAHEVHACDEHDQPGC